MLVRDEGLRLKPYSDTVGKITIGVGRNLVDKGITQEEALALLNTDIVDAVASAHNIFGESAFNSMSRPRQLAITNMIFNLGEQGFSGFKIMISCIKLGNWHGAAAAALQSKWAKQVGKRAERIAFMLSDNQIPKSYL